MNVLLLGPARGSLIDTFNSTGDICTQTEEKLTPVDELITKAEFLVSYGYRHIISQEVLDLFPNRAVNLHISYLPFNRGADPNLWSILEGTPSGVTIHLLDEGLDTGPIIEQRKVTLQYDDTLRTSYNRLAQAVEMLFEVTWPVLRTARCAAVPQRGEGTSHKLKDRTKVEHLLRLGWDTPIVELQDAGKQLLHEELA